MTLLQLSYFVEACNCHNMTKAAAKLNISQPAITKAIQELENEYGVLLLQRRKNSQDLTREGQILYQQAEKLLKQAAVLDATMKQLGSKKKTIRVGLSILFVQLFPELLADYQAKHPFVELKSYAFGTAELQSCLKNDFIDLAISGAPDTSFSNRRVLLKSESYFWTHRENPLAKKDLIEIEKDLHGIPIGLFRESLVYPKDQNIESHYPLTSTCGANLLFCTNQLENIRQKLEENVVSTFLPRHTLDDCPNLVSIPVCPSPQFTFLTYWKESEIPGYILDFVNYVEKYIAVAAGCA